LIDKAVVQGSATASMVIAGREPAKQKCSNWNVAANLN